MRIIAGSLGGRQILTVEGPGYRPATMMVRGAIFSMLEAWGVVWSGTRILDLFAGSGSLGFEALSRGAAQSVFVEKAHIAAECLRKNALRLALGQERCSVVEQDVSVMTRRPPFQPFDVIFVDPPYADGRLIRPVLTNLMRYGWLKPGGFLLIEAEEHLRVDENFSEEMNPVTNRKYGQTRILAWQRTNA